MSASVLSVGDWIGGGIILGYRCPSRCRHCLYGCGPHRTDGMLAEPGGLEKLLDQLAERGPEACYHLGGGEPFLDLKLLFRTVRGLAERGLTLDYIETNGAWVQSRSQAEKVLLELRRWGLHQMQISISPFHAEHIPLAKSQTLLAVAEKVLGGGAFSWNSGFLRDLASQSPRQLLDLSAHLAQRGEAYARGLLIRSSAIAGGRAGRFLAEHGVRMGLQELPSSFPCAERLSDTAHFHVDLQGNYVPGLCAGIVFPLEAVAKELSLDEYPLIGLLVKGGPKALAEYAIGVGFEPLSQGYSSHCDLCTHVRQFLYRRSRYRELGPEGYYDPRSVPGYGTEPLQA